MVKSAGGMAFVHQLLVRFAFPAMTIVDVH